MKKKIATPVVVKAKKPTTKEQLATLRATIREYFNHLRYLQAEYTIKLMLRL